jgi:hypothetical protein
LTPASGRQNHTTSPYASSVVRPRAKRAPTWPASTASRLNVRDDHDTPSFEAGQRKQRTDLRWMIREIFFCRDLDSPNQFESAR